MKIEVVAKTDILPTIDRYMEVDLDATEAETLAEFAGRTCYQSFHKPNEATRANADYLANIRRQEHESVFEHAVISFYVQGASRNLLLELERHRHLSFSVLSGRYVDQSKLGVVIPPANRVPGGPVIRPLSAEEASRYNSEVARLRGEGLKLKEAREAARAELPSGLETRFVVTGNARAWRDVLKKRYSTHADAEIRDFAAEVLEKCRIWAPSIFADFPDEPFGD